MIDLAMMADVPDNDAERARYLNRLGRFYVSASLIRDNPSVVARITRDMIIVRAELLMGLDAVQYDAFCPAFDQSGPHLHPPEYVAICTSHLDAEATIEWKRAETGI